MSTSKARVCVTCELLNDLRILAKEKEANRQMTEILKAAVVQETYTNRQHKGRLTFKARRIKYCPECGRKLRQCETKFKIKQNGGRNEKAEMRSMRHGIYTDNKRSLYGGTNSRTFSSNRDDV